MADTKADNVTPTTPTTPVTPLFDTNLEKRHVLKFLGRLIRAAQHELSSPEKLDPEDVEWLSGALVYHQALYEIADFYPTAEGLESPARAVH